METKYLLFTFHNGKEELKMGVGQDIGIISFNGFESTENQIHTSTLATSDGSFYMGGKVDERSIEISFGIINQSKEEELRRKLQSFFNPKYTIELKVNYCYNQAKIACKVEQFKLNNSLTLWDPKTGVVTLKCPFPYWSDLDDFGRNIAAMTPQFAFPLAIVSFFEDQSYRSKKIMGFKTLSTEVRLNNKGDVPTGLEVQFIAKRGPVVNPKITLLETKEFIEIFARMEKGDVIIVNTNMGKKSIYHNGKNIFKDKNKLSSFFQLEIGENHIQYDSIEDTYTNLDVNVYYTPKYLGV